MKLLDALKALFLMPADRPSGAVRCVVHGRLFHDWMEASFHETMSLGCKFEMVRD
jgi:hypothetical protein